MGMGRAAAAVAGRARRQQQGVPIWLRNHNAIGRAASWHLPRMPAISPSPSTSWPAVRPSPQQKRPCQCSAAAVDRWIYPGPTYAPPIHL
eukprot:scaffold16402_cov118-Isochrysis_galbana.AAC.4